MPTRLPQVLGVSDPCAARGLYESIHDLPGAGRRESLSPMEEVNRLLSQSVRVEAETAEELHAKVDRRGRRRRPRTHSSASDCTHKHDARGMCSS